MVHSHRVWATVRSYPKVVCEVDYLGWPGVFYFCYQAAFGGHRLTRDAWRGLTFYHKVLNVQSLCKLVSTKTKGKKRLLRIPIGEMRQKNYFHVLMCKLKHWKEGICLWWNQNQVPVGPKVLKFFACFFRSDFWNSGFGDCFKGFFLDKGAKKVCKVKRIMNSL